MANGTKKVQNQRIRQALIKIGPKQHVAHLLPAFKIVVWELMKTQTRLSKLEGMLMKAKTKKEKKVSKVMKEFKEGSLHSGSKKGPTVKNKKQAVAIALSEGRKATAAHKLKKK